MKIKMKSKNICCIGAGYVGGPTMAVIASKCPNYKITVVDIDSKRIDLWNGDLHRLPVYEPGLKEVIDATRGKNLFFSNDIDKEIRQADIIFMAVNTPTKTEGKGKGMATDLRFVEKCAERIAKMSLSDKIIVEKSTAPIGTAKRIKEILKLNSKNIKFEIVSNPEFLAEGTAINDLLYPDRILVGSDETPSGKMASKVIVDIYKHWVPENKIITTNLWSSELSKLASNAFLAQRISSINSLSALCDESGANIKEVSRAIGSDSRIGDKFLEASVGFGGSCFKKDILNLVYLCKFYGLNEVAEYWHQVIKINQFQKERFSQRILTILDSDISNQTISILGWAFKKNTNDSRESASIDISSNLLKKDANLNIYDPMVKSSKVKKDLVENLKNQGLSMKEIDTKLLRVRFFDNINDSIKNTDCIAIMTEWDEFKNINIDEISKVTSKKIFIADGRNILNPKNIESSKVKYISVGNSKF